MNTSGKHEMNRETQTQRIERADRQPNADAANATLAAPFHGRNVAELRRLYVHEYSNRNVSVATGERLVAAFREVFNSRHPEACAAPITVK
jgi:predicted SnoaL-like aldol condensation-catalyzing enzyme